VKYEHFVLLYENWMGFQTSVHTLSPCHPLKQYYKSLMAKFFMLPQETQEEYLGRYYETKKDKNNT
jgi:hypothetical protein